MEQSFSFRYIKLGIGLALLLGSSIAPGMAQYLLMTLGAIALMTAFASFGNYDYKGIPTKKGYKIGRYVLVVALFATAAIQIYVQIAMPNSVHFSPYTTVVDVALIAYLVIFKPSETTNKKKILKAVGYTLILIAVNGLQNAKVEVFYFTHTAQESNWWAIMAICIVLLIGILSIFYGGKHSACTLQNAPIIDKPNEISDTLDVIPQKRVKHTQWKYLLFLICPIISAFLLLDLIENMPKEPSFYNLGIDESSRIGHTQYGGRESILINGRSWSKVAITDADYDEWWQQSIIKKLGYWNRDEASKYCGESVLLRIYDFPEEDFEPQNCLQDTIFQIDRDNIFAGYNALYHPTTLYATSDKSKSYFFKMVYIFENGRVYLFDLRQSVDVLYRGNSHKSTFEIVDERFNEIVNSIDFKSYKYFLREKDDYQNRAMPQFHFWSGVLVALSLVSSIIGLTFVILNNGKTNQNNRRLCLSLASFLILASVILGICYFTDYSYHGVSFAFEIVVWYTVVSIPLWIVMLIFKKKSYYPGAPDVKKENRPIGQIVLKGIIFPFAYLSALASIFVDTFSESFKKQKDRLNKP